MEAEAPAVLKRLAHILCMRKEMSGSYHLFLSSTLSLTPALLYQCCDTNDWRTFCSYLSTLSVRDRLLVLSRALQHAPPVEDYLALARLILAGYFSTILTTNIDSALEDALDRVLIERGMRPRSFQTLIVDRDRDEAIARALIERGGTKIRIVKLHGSVHDEVLPTSFPEMFTVRNSLVDSVRRYFNHDIVLFGSLGYDNDINREIGRSGSDSLYYVVPGYPSDTDDVVQVLQARGKTAEDYIIAGTYGECARFFATLEEYIQQEKVQSSSRIATAPLVDLVDPTIPLTVSTMLTASSGSKDVGERASLRADVLLVTVTEIETLAVLHVFREACGHSCVRHTIGKKIYHELGIINDAHIVLVQSEVGAIGEGGSWATVHAGIEALEPTSVIMVGIAFGFGFDKQRLGDIMVSQQLYNYERQRYGTAPDGTPVIIARGDRVTASAKLLNCFKSAALDWPGRLVQKRRGRWGKQVHFGTILTGEKLIDNVAFRDQLRVWEPEAIGGEMEGGGLYAAAQNDKVDWIIVKGICDWADGNKAAEKTVIKANGTIKKTSMKDSDQRVAAKHAAQFIMHVLTRTRLV